MNVSNSSTAGHLPLVRRTIALTVSACAALVLCATANAARPSDSSTETVSSVVVKFRDLDVRTDGGAATLYRRLAAAARRVCPDTAGRTLADKAATWSCRNHVMNTAVEAVNSPQVATLLKNPRLAATR